MLQHLHPVGFLRVQSTDFLVAAAGYETTGRRGRVQGSHAPPQGGKSQNDLVVLGVRQKTGDSGQDSRKDTQMKGRMDRQGEAETRTQVEKTTEKMRNSGKTPGFKGDDEMIDRETQRQTGKETGRERGSQGATPKRYKCQRHSRESDVPSDQIRSSTRPQRNDRGRQERSQRSHEGP